MTHDPSHHGGGSCSFPVPYRVHGERGIDMGQSRRLSAYKLVVFDVRGRVLGTIRIDDDEQRHRASCNDCSRTWSTTRTLGVCVEWIETHDHDTGIAVLPSISQERDDIETVRPFRQPVR